MFKREKSAVIAYMSPIFNISSLSFFDLGSKFIFYFLLVALVFVTVVGVGYFHFLF